MNSKPPIVGAAGGAVGLSAFALALGACCVAPWAVTLLGVSGAVLLARLSYLQPYVVIGTLVLVSLGLWFAYRPGPAGPDATCDVAKQRRLRWLVWIAVAVVIAMDVASFAPYLLY